MSFTRCLLAACLGSWLFCSVLNAQQPVSSASSTVVPRLVNFSGKAADTQGKAISGIAGVTFAIYKDQSEGAPLWLETQNVTADTKGNYTAQLGATKSDGLPLDLFSSGEARWLGVTLNGGQEQPRVLLLSVPYALKAADAETIGGLPPSAFVLANKNQGVVADTRTAAQAKTAAAKNAVPPANPAVTGKGVANYIPMWDTTSDIIDSLIFQKSSQIGVNTTAPAATLDVNGKGDVRDTLTLFPKGTDPTLAISGTTFKVDQTGKITFISGQKFSGAGTITGVTTASGSGLSGGGTSGILSLKVPSAGITNTMLQNSKITLNATSAGGLTTPGAMTLGGTSTIGLKTCAANQVLEYTGSVWNCSAVGSGTVTSVGLSAPSSDFTVSGTPVTSSGTLGLNWNVAPTSTGTANAIVKRDASGSFSAGGISATLGVTSLSPGIAVYGETSGGGGGSDGVHGVAHGTGSGVTGLSDNSNGVGVWAQGPGYALYANGNTGQARNAGGLAKAMVLVHGISPPYNIIERCFNSALSGAAASTPPCGFSIPTAVAGQITVDFGFEVDDRFPSVTLYAANSPNVVTTFAQPTSTNQVTVTSWDGSQTVSTDFYLLLY